MSDFHAKNKEPSYPKRILEYYFAKKPRSAVTILYFLFFGYFIVFFFDNIILIAKFVIRTFFTSTISLGADYLIFGALFIVALALPFLASIAALAIPYEIKKQGWPASTRAIISLISAVVIILFIFFADFSTSYIESRTPIRNFMESR